MISATRLAEPLGCCLGALNAERIGEWRRLITAARSGQAAAPVPSVANAESGDAIRRLYVQMDGVMARLRGNEGRVEAQAWYRGR